MEEFLWVEKYRPHKLSECVLPKTLMNKFQSMVAHKEVPNLLLVGGPGVGKTSVAKAMLDELGCDVYFINGSLKGDKETLRTEITQFASSVSFKKKRKYVILDEADFLTHQVQPALRNFMEEYSKNCGFILTANYPNKILKELRSRVSTVDFNFPRDEAPKLAAHFFGKVCHILTEEKITFEEATVAKVVQRYYPDFRQVLHEIQANSTSGELLDDVLTTKISLGEIVEHMKTKNFTKMREFAAAHSNDNEDVFRAFYNKAQQIFMPVFVPELILIIGRYQYQQSFVADSEINLAAFLVEVSAEATWK